MKMCNDYWIQQSKSFDKSATYYDKYRPSYPQELVTDIISRTKVNSESKILEIGAGSGKATELFVKRGLNITCIEPGENLATEGRRKFEATGQVKYVVSRFEDWTGESESVDLIFSAQAFHWVPKPLGYQLCYKVLKLDKYVGLFWNFYYSTGESVELELINLFKEYPIAYIDSKESLDKKIQINISELQDSQLFKNIDVLTYPWSQVSTTQEYLGFIQTGNGYLTLSEKKKEEVDNRLIKIIESNNGQILRRYQCTLFLAQRK
jgi:SAM-dependent methyltransferase